MNNNETSADTTKITTEHLALEILKQEQAKSKAKNVGIISLTVAVVIIAIGMAVINYQNDREWVRAYYQNDREWRELFNSYDYISQDGEGFNNVNSGTQGNLDNSSEE